MSDTRTLQSHINSQHLYEIATTQDKRLTPSELGHLRTCTTCSDQFAQIVFEYIHQNDESGKQPYKGLAE